MCSSAHEKQYWTLCPVVSTTSLITMSSPPGVCQTIKQKESSTQPSLPWGDGHNSISRVHPTDLVFNKPRAKENLNKISSHPRLLTGSNKDLCLPVRALLTCTHLLGQLLSVWDTPHFQSCGLTWSLLVKMILILKSPGTLDGLSSSQQGLDSLLQGAKSYLLLISEK